MDLKITITGHDDVRKALQSIGRQAPFALSTAVNAVANNAQRSIQDSLANRFTLRRPDFVKRTIFRKPGEDFATKARPIAAVRVHDDPKRQFLAKFEAGGLKTAEAGRNIAIPLNARRNKKEIITTANRPSALKGKKGIVKTGSFILRVAKKATTALYMLKPSVRIKPMLGFRTTAEDAVERTWVNEAEKAIERALRTAR